MKRRKNHLIPFEKSKKVIRLEKRGRVVRGVPVSAVIFWLMGACSVFYCIGIAGMGFGTYFFLIWGVLGAVFVLLGALLANRALIRRLPGWLKAVCLTVFCLGAIVFAAVEGMILTKYDATPTPGADYVIILGAQWKPQGPSNVLQRRLDKAIPYLNENPDTIVIVSGGQGPDEPVSEAAGMRQYLVDIGISDDRILIEDRSTNTWENLAFSGTMLDRENDRIVIVTNNFHMFRAMQIAKKQGYKNVEGLAADALKAMVPNNLLREFLGVVKDYLAGNL